MKCSCNQSWSILMFSFPKKAEVTQISLTGARLIVILGALMDAPRNLEELNALIADCGLIDKNYSDDTLRITISTLRELGCEIARPCKSNNNKYELVYHPFSLQISDAEIQALKTIYSNLTKDSYKRALAFDTLINKLATQVCNNDTANKLFGITSFKKINSEVLETIKLQDGKHNTLTISYYSPTNKLGQYTFVFGKIFLKNNKLYIEGTDTVNNKNYVFNLTRVKKIENIIESETKYIPTTCKVKYRLRNASSHELPIKQNIESINENEAIIVGEFANSFFATQQMLSYGLDCTVIEPLEIKDKVINQLMEMKNIYA